MLVADERRRGPRRRTVLGRAHLRRPRDRRRDGGPRSVAARAVGRPVRTLRGPRRVAPRPPANRPAPLLPVRVPAAADLPEHVRQGRPAARNPDQLPLPPTGRPETRDARPPSAPPPPRPT